LILAILFAAQVPDYQGQVAPVLTKYCAGCHNAEDREGKFSVESFASIQQGAEHGPALLPGDAKGSLMLRLMTTEGKRTMPPKGEPRPSPAEVAVVEAWIAGGAKGPEGEAPPRLALLVPKITPKARVRPVVAMDAARDGRWTAVARDTEVTLFEGTGEVVTRSTRPGRTIGTFPGKVTSIHFTPDGKRLVVASGVAGLGGVASIWEVETGTLVRSFDGHRDLLHDAELSPDGSLLATCGYDKVIEIRDVATGKLLRSLEGHTGAVYDIAFSPDGRFLVSASADDTCKVWRVADGQRMDTLPQPLKAETACLFSPDGASIIAGGADSNIRVWRFVSKDAPAINPMEIARFAHEGAIVRLGFSPDGKTLVSLAEDRTVKAWRVGDYAEVGSWPGQPDVASALAFAAVGATFDIGRMDGSLATYALPAASADAAMPSIAGPTPLAIAATPDTPEMSEREPNDRPDQAQAFAIPGRVSGTISGMLEGVSDADAYRFNAKAGERWVFEVDAARSGSKLDSFVEVLDAEGRKIPRVVLQAVRDSYFTFRGKSGTESGDFRLFNWEEMGINDYLYANGEVVRLWLYPRGPDSGYFVYPGQGMRWGYFDTTPIAHALNEPCYVVRPYPAGTKLIENGLPSFTLPFENDDDARRELGKDSRLTFTVPSDGTYLARVRDVRGLQGADFRYKLTARPLRPDFAVSLLGANPAVAPGCAKEFKVTAKRHDGFEGPIRIEFAGLPPGFQVSSPLVIEAGQLEALGVVYSLDGATAPPKDPAAKGVTVRAVAAVEGSEVAREVNPLGSITLAASPKFRPSIAPAEGGPKPVDSLPGAPLEFVIEPGQTIQLKVVIERDGFIDRVPFGTEGSGRNLPFGTIVDNLGLNGLLVLENQRERTFFVTADKSTPEQVRPFHLTTAAGGGVSTRPVLLRVAAPKSGAGPSTASNR
jgi:hypothetical protein